MAVDNLVFTDEYYFPNWICSRRQTGEDRVNVDDSSHCDFIFHRCECRRRRRQLHLLLQIRRHKIWFVNKMLDSWCHNKVYDPALNGCNNFFQHLVVHLWDEIGSSLFLFFSFHLNLPGYLIMQKLQPNGHVANDACWRLWVRILPGTDHLASSTLNSPTYL